MTIFKYIVPIQDEVTLNMKRGTILYVHQQHGELCVWVRCHKDDPDTPRQFLVVGTGRVAPAPSEAEYVGTAIVGALVWHVFEVCL